MPWYNSLTQIIINIHMIIEIRWIFKWYKHSRAVWQQHISIWNCISKYNFHRIWVQFETCLLKRTPFSAGASYGWVSSGNIGIDLLIIPLLCRQSRENWQSNCHILLMNMFNSLISGWEVTILHGEKRFNYIDIGLKQFRYTIGMSTRWCDIYLYIWPNIYGALFATNNM